MNVLTSEHFFDSVPNASNAPETIGKLFSTLLDHYINFVILVTQLTVLILSNSYKIQETYSWFGLAIHFVEI